MNPVGGNKQYKKEYKKDQENIQPNPAETALEKITIPEVTTEGLQAEVVLPPEPFLS